ncbi:hypothetical protein TNCV_1944081 [Trichonephila clavipes]|nr:hypothetical protein TNCV_1944081 [Trichonephila clavipes]
MRTNGNPEAVQQQQITSGSPNVETLPQQGTKRGSDGLKRRWIQWPEEAVEAGSGGLKRRWKRGSGGLKRRWKRGSGGLWRQHSRQVEIQKKGIQKKGSLAERQSGCRCNEWRHQHSRRVEAAETSVSSLTAAKNRQRYPGAFQQRQMQAEISGSGPATAGYSRVTKWGREGTDRSHMVPVLESKVDASNFGMLCLARNLLRDNVE